MWIRKSFFPFVPPMELNLIPEGVSNNSREILEESTIPVNNAPMKELVDVINKLQEVILSAKLSLDKFHLPQIVVVGGQSSGKSSVLENFVGRDFLPRGSDIVTRCPLLVQLIPNNEEYAIFGHKEEEKYLSFEDVKNEIENRTNFLTKVTTKGISDEGTTKGISFEGTIKRISDEGTTKGISDKPIVLRIYSPHVVDLTLVDLPGLTKVAIKGQPEDIGDKIRKLALKYISDENALILAVSPGNNDIANSDALQLAKEVDPDGSRTYGVITKLDIMDEGTDASNILNNLIYPLKRGYIGIVNRSQKDINTKKDIKKAQKDELEFFGNHPAYKHMKNRMGSKYLQELLSKELAEHIFQKLPDLKERLKKQKNETERQLKTFSDYDGSPQMARRIINDLLLKFGNNSKQLIDGISNDLTHQQLSTGAQIIQFCTELPTILAKEEALFQIKELLLMIANRRGFRYGQSVPEGILEDCIKKLVEIYKDPCNDSVDKIGNILRVMVKNLCQEIEHFPKLKKKIVDLCFNKIEEFELQTKNIIRIVIESQGCFMNTRHPDFRSVTSVEEIPLEYYEEINKHWQNKTTQNPTFFPSINLKAAQKNEIIKEYPVLIKKDEKEFGHFQLLHTTHYLAFYEIQEQLLKFRGKIRISKLKIEDSDHVLELKISTSKTPLPMGGKQMTIMFEDEMQKQLFCSKINPMNLSVGVAPKIEEIEGSLVDKTSEEHLEITAYMVDTYMKIIKKDIADILPKLIKNLLVNELLNFIQLDLSNNLDEQQQELLEQSPDQIRRKEELQNICTATHRALKTLKTMSKDLMMT